MKVIEKGKSPDEAVIMSWDAGMAALASGGYDLVPIDGERDADQPAAQMPAPGTDPVGGKEAAADGQVLTNMVPTVPSGTVSGGLPKSPAAPDPAPAPAPAPAAAAPASTAPAKTAS